MKEDNFHDAVVELGQVLAKEMKLQQMVDALAKFLNSVHRKVKGL